ncbi:MAG: flagellar M-ring protein FliF [Lachnospiraceae bacterium]|nr:flagellar M-ring protein FliF [Lachnospiraceae bacterium]
MNALLERLREIPAKILEWWNKFTTKQKSLIVGAAAAVIFALAIIIYAVSRPQYTRLTTAKDTKEASDIIAILDAASPAIEHRESTDGLTIEVSSSQVSQANLALGAAGFVPDDYGLDQVITGGFTATAADTEKRYKLYLELQFKKDLEAMSFVDEAKVNFDIPQQDGTLMRQEMESSAYIQIQTNANYGADNAKAVARAAATFLGNKTTANITILDYDGNLLYAGGDDYSSAGIASNALELQSQAEGLVANRVKKALLATNQFNNVDVASNLSVDFSEYEKTVKEYYANDDRTEGMLATRDVFEAENTSGTGGIPGTDSNDERTYVYQNAENSNSSQTETNEAFLPNEMAEHSVTPAGSINYNSSSMSIALIKYNELREEDARNRGLLDGITWEEYKAANDRTNRMEVEPEYYSFAANASGIPQENITIIAYEEPLFYDREGLQLNATTILSIILFVLILGLLAFVVLRSMAANRQAEPEEEELSLESMLQSNEEELESIDTEVKSEARRIIEKFVDENPEAAASLLRNWLNEDMY